MIEMKLTQEQLSAKYNLSQGTVSLCLKGIPYETFEAKYSHRPVRFYDEIEALHAFYDYYMAKRDNALKIADEYESSANEFLHLAEEINEREYEAWRDRK